ncbi:MAG: ABC transporter permease [Bacilli bacterium]
MFFKKIITNFKKYQFLLKQLVGRDFKVKYKRSVLGIAWSLLNPLLTMAVMALVFSQMFKFNVPGVNYLVYLLIGLVFFNYFSEASNLAMGSITSNASLISKLYIPKYIFPLSKTLFIGINFLLTLIPLYLIIFITGDVAEGTKCTITWLHLLLPVVFICLFLFTTGLGFILSSVAVFFRDIFYIFGILTSLWMYLTPIMYDLSIIPANFHIIFKLNPLYWFIDFARQIILYNQFPTANCWLWCILSAVVVFLIGLFVFKKKQDKFIYYV